MATRTPERGGSAPSPVPLKDGHRYLTRNGRVIKLFRRDEMNTDEGPGTYLFPWGAVIDGQPRVGGQKLFYTVGGSPYRDERNPFIDAGWDIIDVAPATRLIERDQKAEALERLTRLRAEGVQEEIWVCKDGRHLCVADMDENHVRNTLRMILRTVRRRQYAKSQRDKVLEEFRKEMDEIEAEERRWGSD